MGSEKSAILSFSTNRKASEENMTMDVTTLAEQKYDLLERKLDIGESILDSINPRGRYQFWILVIAFTLAVGTGFVVCLPSYLAPDPIPECADLSNPGVYKLCLESEACALLRQGKDAKLRLVSGSWTDLYGLTCDKAYHRKDGMTVMIFMNGSMPLFALYLSDIYGRTTGFAFSYLCLILGFSMSYFVNDYIIGMAGIGLMNGCCGVVYACLFTVYSTEVTTSKTKLRSIIVGMSFLGYGLGSIVVNLFAYISTAPAFLLMMSFGITGVPGFLCLFLVESPMFELDRGNLDKFEKLITRIGKFNGVKIEDDMQHNSRIDQLRTLVAQTQEISKYQKSRSIMFRYPILALLSSKMYFRRFLIFSIIACNLYCISFGMTVNMQGLGMKDINLNGIIFGVTQSIGYMVVIPFAQKMPRRLWSIIFQFIMLGGSGILIGMSLMLDQNNNTVLLAESIVSCVMFAIPLSAMFTIIFIHVAESFPPELRGTANSLVMLTSNLFAMLTPYFGDIANDIGLHFGVGCSVVCFISLPLAFTLKETLFK